MIWNVDRVIFRIGPVAVRWYGLLFALGFLLGYRILKKIFEREGRDARLLDPLLMYLMIATVVGARLGHVLLYEPGKYLAHPLEIIEIWKGGLASHGGFAAVLVGLVLFCRRHREVPFLWLCDRLTIPAMLAAGLIRIGNFFNSEIIGRPTSVPWAVVFAKVDPLPRHPAQIYEALGYFATSMILYSWYRRSAEGPRAGRLLGLALVLGFGWRFLIEFLKVDQVAFEAALPLDMGQLLSIPFVFAGILLLLRGPPRLGARRDDSGSSPAEEKVNSASGAAASGPHARIREGSPPPAPGRRKNR